MLAIKERSTTVTPSDLLNSVVGAFLLLLFLSIIGMAIADVLGNWIGIYGRGKKTVSTAFLLIVCFGWNLGIITRVFGEPILFSSVVIYVDNFASALIAGWGSGFVWDTFESLISKLKEATEFSKLKKNAVKGDKDAEEKLRKMK